MKILVIDYMDIINQGMEERFRGKEPSEQRLRCSNPNQPAEIIFQRYWIDPNSELATECLLRGIGELREITLS